MAYHLQFQPEVNGAAENIICAATAERKRERKITTSKDVKDDGSLVGAQFFRLGMEHFRRHHEGAGEIMSCSLESSRSAFLVVSHDMGWCQRGGIVHRFC